MTTLTKIFNDETPLKESDLSSYFQKFCKTEAQLKIGVESECFPLDPETQLALPFSGPKGVEALLKRLTERFGWKEVIERGRTVALQRNGELVSLEPGGQVEIATEPLKALTEIDKQLREFYAELYELEKEGRVKWLHQGFQPYSTLDSIEWVPKARYDLMKTHFLKTGKLAHDMMKRTAATQVAVDYLSEADAFKKARLASWISPFVALLAANSPLKEGKVWDWVVPRVLVWQNTDPVRTGIPEMLLKPKCTFAEYLNHVLDTPMIFIVKNNQWIPSHKTFRQYLREGLGDYHATANDFELHLSTLFPEVRIRDYIELRQADSLPIPKAVALAAFWKGLLYSSEALEEGLKVFLQVSVSEFQNFRLESAEKGFKVPLAGRMAKEYTLELLAIAKDGLIRQKENSDYLNPIYPKFS